jgi:hypothetical protein
VVYIVVVYSVVVYSVVTIKKGYYIWRETTVFSFLMLEYDFCFLNWIRVDLNLNYK